MIRPRKNRPISKRHLLLTLGLVSVTGYMALRLVWAAGGAVGFEAESGSLSGGATTASIADASGAAAVKFNGPATPTPTPTPTYDQTILADAPVGYWAVAGTGGTEADLTGGSHTGTYMGGAPTLTTTPNGDQAAVFNGSSQYLTIPTAAAFSIPTTKKLTWEGWIKPTVLQYPSGTNGYIDWMGKCASYSPTCEWEARMYSTTNSQNRCNRLSAYAFNLTAGLGSGADFQPDCNLLQPGVWLHVVGEYQTLTTPSRCSATYPGDINIWVNGVQWNSSYHGTTGCMSQYSVTPTASTSPVNIGVMAGEYWFSGAVGKVAIYDKLLTQAQITAHYTAMTGRTPTGSCANTCTIPVP